MGSACGMFTADRNGGIYATAGTPDQGWSNGKAYRKAMRSWTWRECDSSAVWAALGRASTVHCNGGIYATAGTPDQGWGQWKSVSQGNAGPG